MRRSEPGFERAQTAVEAALEGVAFGTPPPGFSLVEARTMRTVLRGAVEGPDGPVRVVVKWSRPHTFGDRIARWIRGGKGPREARVARALRAQCLPTEGAPVPRDLFTSDEGEDFVVFEEIPALRPLPPADEAPHALVESVARTVALLHAKGLDRVDWTRENLAIAPAGPVLLDLGGARFPCRLRGRARIDELGRAASGLLEGASRATRLRALRAYLGGDREEARSLASEVEAAARRAAVRYRVGRDRRTTRTGRHFEVFTPAGGGRAVRASDVTPASWRALGAGRLLAGAALPGTRVLRASLPERAEPVAVKAFEGTTPLRTPRAIRSFRAGWALLHRRLDAATPLLATGPWWGQGALVTEWIDAPSLLDRWTSAGPAAREEMLVPLARAVRRIHEVGVSHRDLKGSNLLALRDAAGRWRFPVVDFEGVRLHRGIPSARRRARDLARLDASLECSDGERRLLLEAYHRVLPRRGPSFEALEGLVAARSAWKRHRVARRRGLRPPAGAPVG